MTVNRREAIRKVTYIMGGTLSAPAVLGVLQGCAPDPKPNWKPVFFNEEQALTVMELAETIFPATDTLGAKDLGIPKFIETMVGTVYKPEYRDEFVSGLDEFIQSVEEEYGEKFSRMKPEKRLAIVELANAGILEGEFDSSERPFFWAMKELTLLGVFNTEYGATKILQYQLVPGRWEACIPISEAGDGRAYAV